MKELCVETMGGAFRWCYDQEEFQKYLSKGAKPITFLQYLEGTKKEAEEELNDLLKIENCAGWEEAVDSAEEWTGFKNLDDLISFIKGEETTEFKQNTVDLAITNLDELLEQLQKYKERLEEVSDCLDTIQTREKDIEEEKEGEEA